ncbi:hypothetical protein [Dyadobacter aurulentus]|uniref:hypothetical protein n=1 Tax=Dyadobacter sp. UC 10 TaxID=2605428 RepID=UPI0011F25501|nr:hypothetical protein [Dyadobacter sp. UC 10]KAA0992614.1 hypothetical protein FXO21_21790 [Dyadobacter sp. UC 10]
MKVACYYFIFLLISSGCARQPSLPANSPFNVTAVLNDSIWYGTGKVLRLRTSTEKPEQIRKFNLLVFTDIDYPGMGGGPNPNTNNGCRDPECTRTQALVIYKIPLKKGRSKIATLDKQSQVKHEIASFSYIGNSGYLNNGYTYQGAKPGWVRVTRFDKATGTVEGRFEVTFGKDTAYKHRLQDVMPATARFSGGLFRIKLTDVLVR